MLLPDCRQRDDWSCGKALLEAFHIFWNLPLKPALAALPNPISGLAPDTLDAALRASGFSVLSGSMSLPLLKAITKQDVPVGCLVQAEGTGHWILVGSVGPKNVQYMDPLKGIVKKPVAEFDAEWVDFHWLGGEFRRWATVPFLEG